MVALVTLWSATGIQGRFDRYLERQERAHVVLPSVQSGTTKPLIDQSLSSYSSGSSGSSFSSGINWDVPFTPQAPFALWDQLHEEACEEASVLMVLKYFRGERIASPEDAESAIQSLVRRSSELGFPVDLTAEQTRTLILDQDPSLKVDLLRNPSVEALKDDLVRGALIVVPAAGRELRNPYFRRPGPRYHMLVLRGYTADGYVITNDPGTKRGEQFVYRWERLMEAMHDWNNGEVETGAKVAIVVRAK